MNWSVKNSFDFSSSSVSDDDDADDLLYKTLLLLGEKPKPFNKRNGGAAGGQSKSSFVPTIIQTIVTPSTLRVMNIQIGDKLTTLQMVPIWFQPDDRQAAVKDTVYPDNVSNKSQYETVASYRATTGQSNNFYREPLDLREKSTETRILSLDAFAKQFGGELSFTNKDLSFENSTEQMACGIGNTGSVHLLATDSLPTAMFNFKVGLDYKKILLARLIQWAISFLIFLPLSLKQ